MVIFLTSSFVEYQTVNEYVPKPLDESNGFGDNLRKYWIENANFLVFASDPSDEEMADHVTKEMYYAFSLARFSIGEIRCFDNRAIENYISKSGCNIDNAAKEALKEALLWADVVYVSGGHAPTENAFMKKCDLRSLINDREIFDGIYIALSAGVINSADSAYIMPELPGESIDPEFVRFTDGLGLTEINVVPHSQYLKDIDLDGRKMIDEIVAEDSQGREIYLIPDGSYFIIRNGITEFFGEGMIMENGVTRPLRPGIINSDNYKYRRSNKDAIKDNIRVFDSFVSECYDWVLELDSKTGRVEFFYVSNWMIQNGIIPVNIDSFDELNELFSKTLVVEDEKKVFLEQIQIGVILDELRNKGSYVRTVHIDNGEGIRAESIRITKIAGDKEKYIVRLTNITMILDHDWMTDEYSRSGFLAKAEEMLKDPKYQQGYSMVYTNIQGFKAVNDLLGTFSGDMVIFMERAVLVEELEPVLIARLESDHFALITKTENLSAEKMNKLCHQCYVEGSKRLPILIRCGIYHIGNHTTKAQHMLDRAKLAENSILSDHGAPYSVCDEKRSNDYVNQRVLVSEIDSALEKREFLTYYQPIVDAKTGAIVSAEALVRWKHSERGMISPGQFIPVFEKEGIITKIDSFMVDSVLDFNIDRIKKGENVIPCAVNLSRVDFYDTRLLEMLKYKLGRLKDVKNILKLEVTESAYAVLESDAFSFLEEMKKLGLSLLLDDFGSGMSSLSTVESFEFDTIKLDMGFIAKIGKSKMAEAIIKHTIGMSHDVGAKVVAEGVESKEQLEFLQAVDCDMIQGYYFYKPMPEEEFRACLKVNS